MSASDILRPDGSDFDLFLQAEVGEDGTGAAVTVLSALARLELEPWTEARALASLGRDAAHARMISHLAALGDIPSIGEASGSIATRLVALLPSHAPRRVSRLPATLTRGGTRKPVFWVVTGLCVILVFAWVVTLAQTG